ncbi:hypothetical protein [Mycobacterium avium]
MTDTDLRATYFCAAEVIRRRRNTGEPIPQWLRDHYAQLDYMMRMSPPRHHETGIHRDAAQSKQHDLVGADEAAKLLECTTRTVQRKAAALGGQLVGNSWVFNRAAIIEVRRKRHE